jgi:hypothetical protein
MWRYRLLCMNAAQRMPASHVLKGVPRVAFALVLVLAGGVAAAGTDSTDRKPPKPSSLAPHPTARRTFGAPIQPPILHKRHRQGARAEEGTGAHATGNKATARHSSKADKAPK